jgi:hypothetical protein
VGHGRFPSSTWDTIRLSAAKKESERLWESQIAGNAKTKPVKSKGEKIFESNLGTVRLFHLLFHLLTILHGLGMNLFCKNSKSRLCNCHVFQLTALILKPFPDPNSAGKLHSSPAKLCPTFLENAIYLIPLAGRVTLNTLLQKRYYQYWAAIVIRMGFSSLFCCGSRSKTVSNSNERTPNSPAPPPLREPVRTLQTVSLRDETNSPTENLRRRLP